MTNTYLQSLIDIANNESTVASNFHKRIGGSADKLWHLIAAILLKTRIP